MVNKHFCASGIKVGTGAIMEATIIAAPFSTKNEDAKRDPEMHQAKKSNQWCFGLKAHIGVDSRTKIVHAVVSDACQCVLQHAILALTHFRRWISAQPPGFLSPFNGIAFCK